MISVPPEDQVEKVARLCHEAGRNRGAALDVESQLPWDEASEATKAAARAKVEDVLATVAADEAAAAAMRPEVAAEEVDDGRHPDERTRDDIFTVTARDAIAALKE